MAKRLLRGLAVLCALFPIVAHAWWSPDWAHRSKVTLNTSATGVETKDPLAAVPVLVRLHTGNFVFADAKEDGSDIRFVSGDDKTPLKHHIEKFDGANELALIWVQVPRVPANAAAETVWMYYGNKKAAAGEDAKGTYDTPTALVFHFGDKDGAAPKDATAYGNNAGASSGTLNPNGLIGSAMTFAGGAGIAVPASPSIKIPAGGGVTFSAWIKTDTPAQKAVLFAQQDGKNVVQLGLEGGKLVGQAFGATVRGGDVAAGKWQHVALVLGERLAIYLDGVEVGATAAKAVEMTGAITLAAGFTGDMDEVELSFVARPPGWIAAAAGGQGPEQKLVSFGAGEDAESGGDASYFRILLEAVTLDGWIVIGILMVMMVISFAVMILKGIFVARMEKSNQKFLRRFHELSADLTKLDRGAIDDEDEDGDIAPHPEVAGEDYAHSSLYRVYHVSVRELKHRFDVSKQRGQSLTLTPQAIDAIRASLDAGMTRETQRLNSQMVLLTIAISGGPFLGLLGTVVGVMITFAAIAAAGDVNVNSIAPGIAAALVATVAGLAVAIPALFGYNYLASRIANIQADMAVFADELITKLAESYAA